MVEVVKEVVILYRQERVSLCCGLGFSWAGDTDTYHRSTNRKSGGREAH